MNMKFFKAGVSALMSVLVLMSCVVLPAAALDTIGDLNGDEELDMRDAYRVYQIASGVVAPSEAELLEGDTNEDGEIDMRDAYAIYRVASGGENTLPLKPTPIEPAPTYINMLDINNVDSASLRNTTVSEAEGGSLRIESTDEGEIGLIGPGAYDLNALQYTHIVIESDVPFKISFLDGANGRWMTSEGDFFTDFETEYNEATPAGSYSLGLFTYNFYAWGGQTIPETVEMTSIYIMPQAEGTILLKHLALCSTKECGDDCVVGADDLPKPPVNIPEREMSGDFVSITGSAATAKPGDIVDVTFSISENSYVTNGEFNIFWDPTKLEVQEVNEDEDLLYLSYINSGIFKSSWMKLGVPMNDNQYNFGFAGASATSMQGATKGGAMFTMQFKVLDGWTGTEEIVMGIVELCSNAEVEVDNAYNTNCDYFVNATVTVV